MSFSHGFIPRVEPLRELGPEFEAWDALAAELPELHRNLRLRRAVDVLPPFDASESTLDDARVLRACALLAMLAQAYWYVELQPPPALPELIQRPWAQLRRRLGREQEVLSYIDLIVYNWRLRQRALPEPMVVENLDLLLPTVGTREERVFYLTQLEILARASPVVRLVCDAHDAVLRDDPAALEAALLGVIGFLGEIVRVSLPKINPHPLATTHVDPVVWAKTVAPFAVPIHAGDQGPSGTSSPLFNTLDLFFGRKQFRSFLGREIEQLRNGYPPAWRAFLEAIGRVSVGDYVQRKASRSLDSCFREALEVYAGEHGFLGRHRMKVYGYLELAFKVGRAVTIGGFGGVFKDRTWDQVDNELEAARAERRSDAPPSAEVAQVQCPAGAEHPGVQHLTLDISAAAVRYRAGDRCSILPENDPELIERTLVALGAHGDEAVRVTEEWKKAGEARPELSGRDTLSLREVLRFGCIRPLRPRVAEALHARSQSTPLLEALQRGCTERWELWEVLEQLRADGFDVEPLWREPGGGPSERLCQLIPPEQPRLYSIASAAPDQPAETLELAVGSLRYTAVPLPPTAAAAECARPQLRRGTASSFLARAGREQLQVPFDIERPARFRLPADPRTPIVFFAGGTGLAPFLAFLRERSKAPGSGRCWLYWSVREAAELGRVEAELYAAVRAGLLELSVCFTREQVELIDDAERTKALVPGPSRRIDDLMLTAAPQLAELLRPKSSGGLGGTAYVCGSGGFARSVLDALERVLRMGSSEPSHQIGSLLANQRLWLELHSEAPPHTEAERWIDGSEVAQRHDPERGYWMIIDGDVYDLTEFAKLHPGGERIVRAYAGMDGTHGYNRAHERRPEVDALRALYRIGRLRTLELDPRTVEMKTPTETHHVSCRTAHRAWMQALHLVVEMQNALAADYSLQEGSTTLGELAAARSAYKLSRAAETHYRFLEHYQRVLEGETLPRLWRITQALFAPDARPEWMEETLRDVRASRFARDAEALGRDLYERFAEHAQEPGRLARRLELLRTSDTRLLTDLEAALLQGVRAFERHEQRVRTSGIVELWQACHDLPSAFSTRADWLARRLAAPPSTPPPAGEALDALAPPAALYSSEYWRLEAEPDRGLATLRRTPVPWPSLTQLASEIESLLGTLQPQQQKLGLLVDMRLAPLRNDSGFENAMARLRQKLCGHFARTAVLLDSGVGALAAARLERDERRHALCTRSESTALKFLMGSK